VDSKNGVSYAAAGSMSRHRRLRILVVDGNAAVSLGASFARAFVALGQEVSFLDNFPWLGTWSPALYARAARRFVRPLTVPAYNAYVLTRLARLRPDLFFVPKGAGLWPSTISAARCLSGARVVFQTDDFKNTANTTPDMLRAIPLWDAIFTPRRIAVGELAAAGARRVEHLPCAYDPFLSYPPPEGDLDKSLANSAVFVGTVRPERIVALEALARCVPLVVFGSGWERVGARSPLRSLCRPAVYGRQLSVVNASAGVNVAFVAKGNRDEHVMRTFEIPACGGFMLAERTGDHMTLFREDEEAAFFSSTGELGMKASMFLSDPVRRRRIAQAGCRRVTGRERYEDRAARVLDLVRDILWSRANSL
jgi:spore maturation protein CgeB